MCFGEAAVRPKAPKAVIYTSVRVVLLNVAYHSAQPGVKMDHRIEKKRGEKE
jgi:hypothetical protein